MGHLEPWLHTHRIVDTPDLTSLDFVFHLHGTEGLVWPLYMKERSGIFQKHIGGFQGMVQSSSISAITLTSGKKALPSDGWIDFERPGWDGQ